MIEVHRHPDAATVALARSFLAGVETRDGRYGDGDPSWLEILHASFGHIPFLLLSRRESGGIDGYLPLSLVSSRLFGRFLVSLPYVTRAGVVAADADVDARLRDAAIDLARELDVDHLQVRESDPCGDTRFATMRTDKVRMTKVLPRTPAALWRQLGAKVRNQIRKGARGDLELRIGRHELLRDFHRVWSENMRDLGTPGYPLRFFAEVLDGFADGAELAVVDRDGRPVAAALLIHGVRGHGGGWATTVPAASSRRAERPSNVNMWMYHRLLMRAMERGSGEFDFGRSTRGSGAYRFKQQWRCTAIPTCWHYSVRRGDIAALRSDDARHTRRISVWKRLPLWLTRAVGPSIARGIP